MINPVSSVLPEKHLVLPYNKYNRETQGLTQFVENYLGLLEKAGIKDNYDVERLRECVNHTYYAEKECEKGHKTIQYSSCSDEIFCPRCNERNSLERMDKIMSKFEYFKWDNIGKFVFTIPEEYREMVFADKKRFTQVVRDTLNGFFEGVVGGLYVMHEYSTEQPWLLNPHVEVYVSDKILKNRKYTSVRKTVCRVNSKTGKTQPFNPEKNISFKEAWDKRHGRSDYSERKPRELSGVFEDKKSMFLSASALAWLKTVYSFLFNKAFGGKSVSLNVNYCYYQKKNEKSVKALMFHAVPYSLKQPLNPESVVNISAEGVVTYVTRRDNEDIVVMDTVDNMIKVFDLDYYSKRNKKRLCWFGFMSDGVWRDYAKLLSGVFPELVKKRYVDDFFVCSVCGEKVVFVKTNSMVYKWRCEEHDIKHEFIDKVIM